MNNSEKVLEVAERVLLLDSQIEAIKEWILSQQIAPSRERLDRELFDAESRIRNGQQFRERSDELRILMQSQDDPAELIQLLHDRVLYTQSVLGE